jgi:hypothetical protein
MVYRTKSDLSPAGAYKPNAQGKIRRRKISRSPEERIEVFLPLQPVISEEQHRYIVDIVEAHRIRRYAVRLQSQPEFTYRGFLYCNSCRQPIYTHVSNPGKHSYHCKSKLPRYRGTLAYLQCTNQYMSKHLLEPKLDRVLFRFLSDRGFLAARIHEHFSKSQTQVLSTDSIHDQIRSLEAKKERLTDAYVLDRHYTREQYQARINAINGRLAQLRNLSQREATPFRPENLIQVVQFFREWLLLSSNQRRRVLEAMVPSIYVNRYEVAGVDLWLADGDSGDAPRTDAALPGRDAALPDRDAALPDRDAALPDRDATLPDRDAALPDRDATLPDRDAALPDRDATLLGRDATLPG